MSKETAGKVILVTGASTVIGARRHHSSLWKLAF